MKYDFVENALTTVCRSDSNHRRTGNINYYIALLTGSLVASDGSTWQHSHTIYPFTIAILLLCIHESRFYLPDDSRRK